VAGGPARGLHNTAILGAGLMRNVTKQSCGRALATAGRCSPP
jgi:hypothetical protein